MQVIASYDDNVNIISYPFTSDAHNMKDYAVVFNLVLSVGDILLDSN